MSHMIPDGRQASKAINEMIDDTANWRIMPKPEGEVEFHVNAYLYGHFDSRGGSSLILGPSTGIAAHLTYNITLSGGETWDDPDMATEDFVSRIQLSVFGQALPADGGEILAGYADENGYFMYRAHCRTRYQREKRYMGWEPTDYYALVKLSDDDYQTYLKSTRGAESFTKKFAPPPSKSERLMGGKPWAVDEFKWTYEDVGEDAFGLILIRTSDEDIKKMLKESLK